MKNQLAHLRGERHWSQQALAEKVGVSRQTIIFIERVRFDPSLPLAFRLADAFGTTIERIFELEPEAD